jgi:serine/threonine-protein kinase RsbT
MSEAESGALMLRVEADIVRCRQEVRRLAQRIKFSLVEQTKMITAASELARNTLVSGDGGEMRWDFPVRDSGSRGLRLAFEDSRPPASHLHPVPCAHDCGCTGLGIATSRRLVDDFTVRLESGECTCVTIVRWK